MYISILVTNFLMNFKIRGQIGKLGYDFQNYRMYLCFRILVLKVRFLPVRKTTTQLNAFCIKLRFSIYKKITYHIFRPIVSSAAARAIAAEVSNTSLHSPFAVRFTDEWDDTDGWDGWAGDKKCRSNLNNYNYTQ